MDVKALYRNIPNNESIAPVKGKCDNYTKKAVATKVTTTFLTLILTLKFHFQLKVLPSNQGLCHESDMYRYMRKHIHVRVQREIHPSFQ